MVRRRCRYGLLGASLALTACSLTPVDSHVTGYLTTPQGGLLKNADGQCWRTAEWRPELAIAECDPELVRRRRERGLPVAEAEPEVDAVEPDRSAWQPTQEPQAEQPAVADTPVMQQPSQRVLDALPAPALMPTLTLTEDRPLSLSGDATFHFGHHRLTPRGRESLEYLAHAIRRQQARELKLDITGHSDRIGDRQGNLALSQRRADTVRDALIELGIDGAVITAQGKGSAEPVTTLEDCPGDLVRCELINCLAPDRRVEIRVSGIREVRR
jgi:OmpA-OmpF porin, OOP family